MSERRLADEAERLRSLHHGGEPLVLPNAWDAESARLVAAAGFPVVATSSSAVAASLGEADGEHMSAGTAFEALRRIASAVDVPVTADIEAGYGLGPEELVDRLLEAGAVGCNLEDSDHHGDGVLVPAAAQVERIEAVRDAAARAGVPVVVNARVDVFIRRFGSADSRMGEAVSRGRAYLAAGAACCYPIGLVEEPSVAQFVEGVGGPVNVWLRPDSLPVARLAELGVARVSLASGLQRVASASIASALSELKAGRFEAV